MSSDAAVPYSFTQAAYILSSSNATLNGFATPNGLPSTAWFEWGGRGTYGFSTTPTDVGSGTAVVHVSTEIAGLASGNAYQCRLVVSNAAGLVHGAARLFTSGRKPAIWGYQATTLGGLSNIVGVAAGLGNSLVLKADGTVVVSTGSYAAPPNLSDVVAVASGYFHSLALKTDGTLIAWGDNQSGQTNVPPGLNNVIEVAAGVSHSLALRRDGSIVAWGSNGYGETNVPLGLSNVVSVACGWGHSLALKANGAVVGWGYSSAQTGLPNQLTNLVAIAAGGWHGLALKADGTATAWGNGSFGETGVPLGLSNVVAVAAGSGHNLALKTDGTVTAWGNSSGGATAVPSGLTNVVAITCGSQHNVALGNQIPQVASQSVSGPANHDFIIQLGASDGDNEALNIRITALPQSGVLYQYVGGARGAMIATANTKVDDLGKRVIFAAATNSFGMPYTSFDFVANDGEIDSTTATVTVSVIGKAQAFTQLPTNIRSDAVDLHGIIVPNGLPTMAWFEWGPNFGQMSSLLNAGSGTSMLRISTEINGLTNSTVYQCRLAVSNAAGLIYGATQLFTTGGKVSVWGSTNSGATIVPKGLNNVVAIAAGSSHHLVLRSDGTIIGWGNNTSGQANAPAGLSNAVAVSAGGSHNLAIQPNGTVFAWGSNNVGQTNVPSGLSNVMAVSAGDWHSLAVKADGSVVAWGWNADGQTNVPPGLSNVVAVAAGNSHNLALKSDGTVTAWGWGVLGQTNVPAGLTNVTAIAAGGWRSLALKADGTAVGWGHNSVVPSGISNLVAIASGSDHSLAIKIDGSIVTWGANGSGQSTVPVSLTNVVAIGGGSGSSLAIGNQSPQAIAQTVSVSANHDLIIQLGSFDPNGDSMNLRVTSLPQEGVLHQYSNGIRGAAISSPGTAVEDFLGRLIFAPAANAFGNPYTMFHFVANDGEVDSLPATITIVVVGQPRTFTQSPTDIRDKSAMLNGMILPNGFATTAWFEWGVRGSYTESTIPVSLGDGGTVIHAATPITGLTNRGLYQYRVVSSNATGVAYGATQLFTTGRKIIGWAYYLSNNYGQAVPPSGLDEVVAIAGGTNHSLALKADGSVVAWGRNDFGQTNLPIGLNNVSALAAGGEHNLALMADRTVIAWGNNSEGQVTIPLGLNDVVAVAGGYAHSLALKADGTLAAWGLNTFGQGSIPSGLENVVAVASGKEFNLALKADGKVVAWGRNDRGQTNVPANLSNVVAIACSHWAGLAVKADGKVVAWGDNLYGVTNVPANLSNVVSVVAGASYATALKTDGTLSVWGHPSSFPPTGFTNAVSLAGGAHHTLSLANRGPLSASTTKTTYVNSDTVFTPPAFDPDNDTLSYRIVSLPLLGELYQYNTGGRGALITVTNTPLSDTLGRVIFAPAPDDLGAPYTSFSFIASDGEVEATTRTITINVVLPPAPQISATGSRFTNGQFELNFSGESSATYRVWASTNLLHWDLLGTASPVGNGWFQMFDSSASNYPKRFYRAGAVGSSRVDLQACKLEYSIVSPK